jgi:hypothetical protein
MSKRYTVCVDFDGVIHSYTSPWTKARHIPDPPVKGALQFLVETLKSFDVAIFSTRNFQFGGRRAMRKWLIKHLCDLAEDYESTPKWWLDIINETSFADPWEDEVLWAAERIVWKIQFPRHKPAALVYLDDRALRFTGPDSWPTKTQIHLLKPWNKV